MYGPKKNVLSNRDYFLHLNTVGATHSGWLRSLNLGVLDKVGGPTS